MLRWLAAAAALVSMAACGDEGAERAAHEAWSRIETAHAAAPYTAALSERIAERAKAVAALDEYARKFSSTAHAREKATQAAEIRARLGAEQKLQASMPCLAPPHRACLIAEAEKRIQARTEFEAEQAAALLAATGDRRHETRLLGLLKADARIDSIGRVIVAAGAARSAAALEALAAYGARHALHSEAAAIVAHVRGDGAAYAAEIERFRAAGRLGHRAARAIARHTADRALFAEAIRQIRAMAPGLESSSELGLTMAEMAAAGLAEDVWAIDPAAGPTRPDPVWAYAAHLQAAGQRKDGARLDALLKAEIVLGTGGRPVPLPKAGALVNAWTAYALARLERIEEAKALIRDQRIDARRAPPALTEIALWHARQGRKREALDVVFAIEAEFEGLGNLSPMIAALLGLAAAGP